jgi:ABC-type hemin transport system substrate-binding protein
VRPPQARREKPRVSAFTSANIDKILALNPDLVLTFSDLQAGIAADLIRRGLDVHAFNQRSVAGILDMIRMVIETAGGVDIFADRALQSAGKDRVVTIDEVVARKPDLSSPYSSRRVNFARSMTALECEPRPISFPPSVARTANSIWRPSTFLLLPPRP